MHCMTLILFAEALLGCKKHFHFLFQRYTALQFFQSRSKLKVSSEILIFRFFISTKNLLVSFKLTYSAKQKQYLTILRMMKLFLCVLSFQFLFQETITKMCETFLSLISILFEVSTMFQRNFNAKNEVHVYDAERNEKYLLGDESFQLMNFRSQ